MTAYRTTATAFLVDRNVGRLGKWLRAFGLNAEFADDGADGELVRRAMREGRAIVTKDRKLLERRVIAGGELPAMLITADHLGVQPREFFAVVSPDPALLFSRCIRCNVLLHAAPKEDVHGEVPPFAASCRRRLPMTKALQPSGRRFPNASPSHGRW